MMERGGALSHGSASDLGSDLTVREDPEALGEKPSGQ